MNSPQQLSEVLFERLQLQAGKKPARRAPCRRRVDVLEELALAHEVPALC